MALSPGTRIGPYELVSQVGAGGMGEVYRGLDTRLNRPVAIKCSRGPFSERFHGEARAISALNHAHICTLYDVGPDYLVMELVEGDTLAARLTKGALPTDQVLRYGAQIADALAAAHAVGLIHRDIKPANIMLTKAGVKVLDFGLAKFSGSLAETAIATQGIVGTPAYMAPEQLAGESADACTDIFALGLVLYEMATGRRVLVGHGQPPMLDDLPERLAHIIDRCLMKERDERWQSAADVRRELEWVAKSAGSQASAPTARETHARSRNVRLALAGTVLALAALAAGVGLSRMLTNDMTPDAGVASRTTISLPQGLRLESSVPMALSPDGTLLALVAVDEDGTRQLYLRPLTSSDAKVVPGTVGAMHPFFSPDGRSIGFFAEGALQRVDVGGGAPVRICPLPGVDAGGAWGSGDIIVVAIRGRGLFTVSAAGGTLMQIEPMVPARWPSFLPDDKTILYASIGEGQTIGFSVVSTDGTGRRDIARLSDKDGGGAPVLGATAEVSQATLLPSGHLVYGQDPGFVRALPMDPSSLVPRGSMRPLGDSVERAASAGGIAFAVSRNGLLVFADTGNEHQLVWMTRQGVVTPLNVERAAYRQPRLSPDGKAIAVSANDDTRTPNLWLISVERGTRTRVASESMMPAWTPDGRQLAFTFEGQIAVTSLTGAPPEVLLTREQARATLTLGTAPYPSGWSPDGRYLLIQADTQDVLRLSRSDCTLEPVLMGPNLDWGASVSPDGRAVTYVSNEAGRLEVYVARWPTFAQKTAVSTNGGVYPRWSPDSRELFFWQGQPMMAAPISPSLEVGVPKRLFSGAFVGAARDATFDVAADGRFLMVKSDERAELRQLTVVQHWMRAATGRE